MSQWSMRAAGFLLAWFTCGASSESPAVTPDEKLVRCEAVLSSDMKAAMGQIKILQMMKVEHERLSFFQDPAGPDQVLANGNSEELKLIDQLTNDSLRVAKAIASAGVILTGNERPLDFSGAVNELIAMKNDLGKIQTSLDEGRERREAYGQHLSQALDRWAQAHPDANTELVERARTVDDPKRLDQAVQNEQQITILALKILLAALT